MDQNNNNNNSPNNNPYSIYGMSDSTGNGDPASQQSAALMQMYAALTQNLTQNYFPIGSNGQVPIPFNLYSTSAPQITANTQAIGYSATNIQQSNLAAFNPLQNMNQLDVNPRPNYQVVLGNGSSMRTTQQTVGNVANNQTNAAYSHSNTRDSSWLKLAVCPNFLAGTCSYSRDDCEYAHPEANIRVENGTVTVCFDHMKRGECKYPSCKYFHVSDRQKAIVEKQGGNHRPNSINATNIFPGPCLSDQLNFAFGTTQTSSLVQPQITSEALLFALKRGGQIPFQQILPLNPNPFVPYLRNFGMGQNVQENISTTYATGFPLSDPSSLALATYRIKRATELSIENTLNSVLGSKRTTDGNGSEILAPPMKRPCMESALPAMANEHLNGDAISMLNPVHLPDGNYYTNSTNLSNAHSPSTTHPSILSGGRSFQTRCALLTEDGQPVESVEVCRDFLAGRCSRSVSCNYLHAENLKNLEVVNNRVQICRDALSDRCDRDKCRHYHIPTEILIKHVPTHGLDNNESIETAAENAAVNKSSSLKRTTSNSNSAGTNGNFRSPGLERVFLSPQSSDPRLARGDPNGSC
ncbi:unnamed protein product [Hymenolepis diminuta]|uniref:C3H1-type domain-containing protein n=1 Tax=Hymenolepis diminuta TaxID=6216 RepID=A0A158QCU1_HYMDI|nr:unnamed protein product [Hymenolepis diminuta]